MTDYNISNANCLCSRSTGAPVGLLGADGKEYPIAVGALGGAPGSVVITGGSIDGAAIGQTTAAAVKYSALQTTFTNSSGSPGNVTNSSPRGRAAFAAAGTTVVVTSTICVSNSTVLVQLGGSDATLTSVRVTAAAGSFTVSGNAAATGITPFDFVIIN
jgi:hypothetical protein